MPADRNPAVTIRALAAPDAAACDAIILGLPYHFGDPGGREECARAVRRDRGLVAVAAGEVVGFLTVMRHFPASAEITWMAVRADRRGRGLGGQLIAHLCVTLTAEGCQLLLVMTLSSLCDEGGTTDGYGRTRAFYRSHGFFDAREVPELWPNSPALLMIRPLIANSQRGQG